MHHKIVITGCAGFIGSHLSEKLISEDEYVIGIDNFNTYYSPEIKEKNILNVLNSPNFKLIRTDIRDISKMEEVFKNDAPDIIVHLAARAGVRPSLKDPLLYEDVNINGTLNILKLASKYHIKKIVFASSSSVYGCCKNIPFSETDNNLFPISPYGITKRAGEFYCRDFHNSTNIPINCLRFFTVYGPRQRPDMGIHLFTKLILDKKEITLFGDGQSQRDYTFIEDIISGINAAIKIDCGFEIFNLGNSNTITLIGLIQALEKETGLRAKLKHIHDQPGDVPITYSNISKAKSLLGYEPKTSINAGLQAFINWYKKEYFN